MAASIAVLFDLDGTLLDANQSIRQTMNHVLAEKGQPTFTKAELDALIGHPLREILATKVKDASLIEPMALRYREVYGESGWVTVELFPGLEDLLRHLRAAGWPIGVVTSKGEQEAETVLFDLGVAQLFDAIVGDDDQRPLKPDPAPVHEAARRLKVPVGHCVMIGDTRFDIEAARAAGAYAIGVLWGNGSKESLEKAGSHATAKDASALAQLLERLAARIES